MLRVNALVHHGQAAQRWLSFGLKTNPHNAAPSASLHAPVRLASGTVAPPDAIARRETDADESTTEHTYSFYEELDLGGEPHPARLVETTALASVARQQPEAALFGGRVPAGLSNVQLEAIALAADAHEDTTALAELGSRRGFLCGDGTGCGKGRTIAGCVLHNLTAGRRRSVWVSASDRLSSDAQRDFNDISGDDAVIPVRSQGKWKASVPIDLADGCLFTTYTLLARGDRMQQLLEWCGPSFDGVLALDEVHRVANPTTKSAQGVSYLQQMLPEARLFYATATTPNVGSTGQLLRLHLWGPGLPYEDAGVFMKALGDDVGAGEVCHAASSPSQRTQEHRPLLLLHRCSRWTSRRVVSSVHGLSHLMAPPLKLSWNRSRPHSVPLTMRPPGCGCVSCPRSLETRKHRRKLAPFSGASTCDSFSSCCSLPK